jgi:hypothetical protein
LLNSLHLTAASCLGHGLEATLRAKKSGLAPCAFETATDQAIYVDEVAESAGS